MNDFTRGNLVNEFTDTEYTLLVLHSLKRCLRKSEHVLQWIPPRYWAAGEPDRRQVLDSLDNAIDIIRSQVEQQTRGPRL